MSKPTFGAIAFSGKDIALPAVKFDRIAIGPRGHLYLVSVVAETQRVKSIRAILCGGAKATITATGAHVSQPNNKFACPRDPGSLYATEEGYQVHIQKMNYGLAHALFVTRRPGFMPVVSPETLWRELNDTRFTTPLLREWLPYINTKLREDDLLEEAHVFNVSCGVLTAHTGNLDQIVADGLQTGAISIPGLGSVPTPVRKEPAPEPAEHFEYGDPVTWVEAGVTITGEFRYGEDNGLASVKRFVLSVGGVPIGKVVKVDRKLLVRKDGLP